MAQELDEAWVEEAISRHRRIEQLQAEFEARVSKAEVTVHSPDHLVEVLVCADGTVRRVRIVGDLPGRTNAEVSGSVEAAIAAAADAAEWARRTLYSEIFGSFAPLGGS
jgi:DNA-binding protein YbaB